MFLKKWVQKGLIRTWKSVENRNVIDSAIKTLIFVKKFMLISYKPMSIHHELREYQTGNVVKDVKVLL